MVALPCAPAPVSDSSNGRRAHSNRCVRTLCLGIVCIWLAACEPTEESASGKSQGPPEQPQATLGPDSELIAINNRGVGQMGQFDYAEARSTFAAVVDRAPAWIPGRINLAIATLNRQEPGDDARAMELVQAVLAEAPDNLRAHYVAGILNFNAGDIEPALIHFDRVRKADPQDAYAAYYAGQSLLQLGRADEAMAVLQDAMAADPYLRSAFYGGFLAAQRLGQPERARELLAEYQRLEDDPRSRLAEIKYTRMGPRAEAVAVRSEPAAAAAYQRPAPFAEQARELATDVDPIAILSSVPLVEPGGRSVALVLDRQQGLQLIGLGDGMRIEAPFVGDRLVQAAAWGDFDNDGLADLYLGRRGDNHLWRGTPDGRWVEVSAETATGLAGSDSRDVLFVDADHDGDLDLFVVNADGPDELLNNNGDGTFRPLAAERGLGGDGSTRAVLAYDLDRDRDVDLVVFRDGQPPLIHINDRIWNYRTMEGPAGFTPPSGLAVDLDANGRSELCGLHAGELSCWEYEDGRWRRNRFASVADDYRELAIIDDDADGQWEFLAAGDQQWAVLRTAPFGELAQSGKGAVQAVAYPVPGAGPALLVAVGSSLNLLGPLEGPYLSLSFTGREAPGESMRSNRSGLGTRFVVRAGSRWTAGWFLQSDSGPGNGLQPVAIGLDGQLEAEYIEIDWSDGVFQTELGLTPGEHHRIAETQRQLASCPVLFAWDGESYRFLSDVLGVGGLGFAVGPGEYAEPRPWERFRIDADSLAEKAGAFELKLTEPMEEIAYVDAVGLVAYDYPPTFEARLDERMATDGNQPSGEMVFFRQALAPRRAVNERGVDVSGPLLATDGTAAAPGPVDRRFIGLLENEQILTLVFDQDLSRLRQPVLIMDGWIEYGYSQTSFAAWQAGRSYQPPSLEARDGAGRWHLVAPNFGYPAGMPREALYPLPALPPGTRALRLRTNQEIYFDRLAVAERVHPDAVETRLTLMDARVERIGFPRRTTGPQRRPDFDYSRRKPFWDTRYQRGFYTAMGPAAELVSEADNALAIIGPGDALSLRFRAGDLPPLREGWSRSLVIELHGWAKDMDLYTRDGETVAPVPSSERGHDRAAELHAIYNTRFLSGR